MVQQTKTATRQQQAPAPQSDASKGQVAVLAPPRILPPAESVLKQYDVTSDGWRALVESIFPAAVSPAAVVMALEYCARRKLDVFKKPVHIVPIWNSRANGGSGGMVETVWPGISELRTTAMRTGQYGGMDVPVFGPTIEETFKGRIKKYGQRGGESYEDVSRDVRYPEWCQITVYRVLAGNRIPFPGPRVYWREAFAYIRNGVAVPNEMWVKRPNGQLEKCAEAAALRRAFPEELGNEMSADEAEAFSTHQARDVTTEGAAVVGAAPAAEPRREDYDETNKGSVPGSSVSPGSEAGQRSGNATPASAAGDPAPQMDAGQPEPAKPVTDVEDLNERDKSVLSDDDDAVPGAPPLFENYTKAGDFFAFADEYLSPEVERTEAEYVAFSTFYYKFIMERLDPNWRSRAVHEAMVDTKRMLDEAMDRAQKRGKAAG